MWICRATSPSVMVTLACVDRGWYRRVAAVDLSALIVYVMPQLYALAIPEQVERSRSVSLFGSSWPARLLEHVLTPLQQARPERGPPGSEQRGAFHAWRAQQAAA